MRIRLVLPLLLLPSMFPLPAGGAKPDTDLTVVIRAADSRFGELSTQIATEIESLLAPGNGDWRVEVRGPEPDSSDPFADASIGVWVGAKPDDASFAVPTVRVDPVGRIPGTESRSPDERRVAAPDFEETVGRDLAAFRDLLRRLYPDFDRLEIHVPLDPWLADLAPAVERAATDAGVEIRRIPAEELPTEAAPDGILWALYLPPGLELDAEPLARNLAERGIPSVSGRGRADVLAGLLAARAAPSRLRLARQTALQVVGLVRGLPPAETSPPNGAGDDGIGDRWVIHRGTADALGIELPWRLRLWAELVGEPTSKEPTLSVDQARTEAVEANLDVRGRALATAAGEQEIRRALAELRPQVSVSAQARVLDEESAEAAFGSRPEQLVTAAGEASWILFSEDARSAVDEARFLQAARELELRELELDIGLGAAVTLLEVARARAFEAVEKENLDLTYAELDAARSRRAAGTSDRSDVARLEARAARDRQALVAAYGARRAAEVRLQRLLSRPLDREVVPVVAGAPENPSAEPEELPWEELVSRSHAFAALGREMLDRARSRAPELAAADEVIHARERALLAARRALYLPTARAFALVETRLDEGGAGTEAPSLPGGAGAFPETPDTTWSLGLGVSLPIFTGGARDARRARAELALEEARVLRARAEQRVEERVRLALLGVETAFEAARQARVAARAAREAYEVVENGYLRGRESLTTLLDAQTEWRNARQARAAAAYAALARRLELQRAAGEFLDPAAEHELIQHLTEPTHVDPLLSSEDSP